MNDLSFMKVLKFNLSFTKLLAQFLNKIDLILFIMQNNKYIVLLTNIKDWLLQFLSKFKYNIV